MSQQMKWVILTCCIVEHYLEGRVNVKCIKVRYSCLEIPATFTWTDFLSFMLIPPVKFKSKRMTIKWELFKTYSKETIWQ